MKPTLDLIKLIVSQMLSASSDSIVIQQRSQSTAGEHYLQLITRQGIVSIQSPPVKSTPVDLPVKDIGGVDNWSAMTAGIITSSAATDIPENVVKAASAVGLDELANVEVLLNRGGKSLAPAHALDHPGDIIALGGRNSITWLWGGADKTAMKDLSNRWTVNSDDMSGKCCSILPWTVAVNHILRHVGDADTDVVSGVSVGQLRGNPIVRVVSDKLKMVVTCNVNPVDEGTQLSYRPDGGSVVEVVTGKNFEFNVKGGNNMKASVIDIAAAVKAANAPAPVVKQQEPEKVETTVAANPAEPAEPVETETPVAPEAVQKFEVVEEPVQVASQEPDTATKQDTQEVKSFEETVTLMGDYLAVLKDAVKAFDKCLRSLAKGRKEETKDLKATVSKLEKDNKILESKLEQYKKFEPVIDALKRVQ